MMRVSLLIFSVAAVFCLSACGDKPQSAGGVKGDVAPYQGVDNKFAAPGWKAGGRRRPTSWSNLWTTCSSGNSPGRSHEPQQALLVCVTTLEDARKHSQLYDSLWYPGPSSGQASTVYHLLERRVVRQGEVTEAQILEVLG